MIRLRDVGVRYGPVTALHPVNLTFEPGSFTVLLGPSGAGKSTLLRCMNYLVVPSSGAVEVDGIGPLRGGPVLRAHRRRTGMVFQQHQLIGRYTALRNVLLGTIGGVSTMRSLLPPARLRQYRALEALERVGLLAKAASRADQLSGGEQQRVGIARALAQEPVAVLADEPVASLDPATSVTVLGLLRRICQEDGITAVVSLHQVELARRFADRVVGLSGGRVVADAHPDRLDTSLLSEIYERADAEADVPAALVTAAARRRPTTEES